MSRDESKENRVLFVPSLREIITSLSIPRHRTILPSLLFWLLFFFFFILLTPPQTIFRTRDHDFRILHTWLSICTKFQLYPTTLNFGSFLGLALIFKGAGQSVCRSVGELFVLNGSWELWNYSQVDWREIFSSINLHAGRRHFCTKYDSGAVLYTYLRYFGKF